MIILWACYFVGSALHILKRANLSAASPISQGTRMRDFLARNWPSILIRFACTTGIFMAWLDPSRQIDKLLPYIGLGSVIGAFPAPDHTSYFFASVAGAFGFLLDSLVDWVIAKFAPGLQKELPAIPEQGV